jgi:amino acid permease
VTARPDSYIYIVYGVIGFTAISYMLFGMFCVFAWGGEQIDGAGVVTNEGITALISDELPHNFVGYTVLVLFSLNLLFSFPLILYPAHKIIETYLYNGWPKSKKRQMSKNTNRTLLVAFIVMVTVALGEKIDKFLSILGALTCTPIAFSFPTLFHYKACAKTPIEKTKDMALFGLSMVILIYCTTLSVMNW